MMSALTRSELEAFHAHVAMLTDAGLPLPDGLRQLARAGRKTAFHAALERLAAGLEAGLTLAEAMAREPGAFSTPYLALIKVGEKSGDLKGALALALEQEFFRRNLTARVQRAIIYPLMVLVIVTATYLVCIARSYPMLLSLMDAAAGTAPGLTLAVYRLCDVLIQYWIAAAVILAALAAASRLAPVREWLHAIAFKVPFLGTVLVSRFLASFSKGMEIGLKAGITPADTLELLAEMTPNLALRAALQKAAVRSAQGETLSRVLPGIVTAPEFFLASLAAGEDAQVLPAALAQLADISRDETRHQAKLFIQVLDTVLIIGLGIWVGVILVAFYLLYLTMALAIDHNTLW